MSSTAGALVPKNSTATASPHISAHTNGRVSGPNMMRETSWVVVVAVVAAAAANVVVAVAKVVMVVMLALCVCVCVYVCRCPHQRNRSVKVSPNSGLCRMWLKPVWSRTSCGTHGGNAGETSRWFQGTGCAWWRRATHELSAACCALWWLAGAVQHALAPSPWQPAGARDVASPPTRAAAGRQTAGGRRGLTCCLR
jgi:hypothetical protein